MRSKTTLAKEGEEFDFDLDEAILDDNNPQVKNTDVRYSYTTNDILNNKNPRASKCSQNSYNEDVLN